MPMTSAVARRVLVVQRRLTHYRVPFFEILRRDLRSAGLELYETEESPARRAAGEAVCGTTLDLGRLRLDCAFFRWRMEGREGVGRYDVLRRV